MTTAQVVDPEVSRAKFRHEIGDFQALEKEYRGRGWLLLRADFPIVLVALAAPQLQPPAIVTGVRFDYTNYDMIPPSVQLVNPFTEEPYSYAQVPTRLNRSTTNSGMAWQLPGMPPGARLQVNAIQPLMQASTPDEIPFLCIAGVREYHEHPAHSGDAWDLHRASGAGRLVRLLDVIHRYGIQSIAAYDVKLVPQISFQEGQPAE